MKRGKFVEKAVNFITSTLIIVTVILAFTIVSAKVSGKDPSVFGYQIKTVLSGSMEPEIQTGSIILNKKTNSETLKEGDVVTFLTEENILVTHRIIEVVGNEYITKGDNNSGKDVQPILPQNITGKYTGITIPYVGYVLNFANTNVGSALLLVLPGLYLVGYSIRIITRSLKQVENQTPAKNEK